MGDVYKEFAKEYDRFGYIKEINQQEQDFFTRIFQENEVEHILDCSCGTGHHCYMFNQMGYGVKGSDYSVHMLEQAEKNLKGLDIDLRQCDFRNLEEAFDEKFDAVVCLTTSLPHLHDEEDLIKALKSMGERLIDGGILILTQSTTHQSIKEKHAIDVVVNDKNFSRVFVKEIEGDIQRINIVDLYHSDEEQTAKQYRIVYKIILDDDYRMLLKKAGFSDIQIYGGYDQSNYNPNHSRKLIVVATK